MENVDGHKYIENICLFLSLWFEVMGMENVNVH